MAMELSDFIDVKTAAKELDCSPATIYRLVKEKTLPSYRLGTGRKSGIRLNRQELTAAFIPTTK